MGEEGDKLKTYTSELKLISEYASLPLLSVSNLNILVYDILLYDATIYQLRQSEKGQELLKVLSRITVKDAEIDKIRAKINKQ